MGLDQIDREAARRHMLTVLAGEPDGRRDAATLHRLLRELACIRRPIEWVIDQLTWLESMDAVSLKRIGPVVVAEITLKGQQYVDREISITGIDPMPRREG